MVVYFISGLGADQTAFEKLTLQGIEPIHLSWIEPAGNESIESYAGRMAERITTPDPIIIGLSFGGMMAIEIAKVIRVKKIILISSAKGKKELPAYFTFCRILPFHKILPFRMLSRNSKIMSLVFGARNKEQQKRLVQIVENRSHFNDWAIDKVVRWKNMHTPDNVVHIHGDADKLLPYRYVQADHTIRGGGHFMVVNQCKEISALLQKLISL